MSLIINGIDFDKRLTECKIGLYCLIGLMWYDDKIKSQARDVLDLYKETGVMVIKNGMSPELEDYFRNVHVTRDIMFQIVGIKVPIKNKFIPPKYTS